MRLNINFNLYIYIIHKFYTNVETFHCITCSQRIELPAHDTSQNLRGREHIQIGKVLGDYTPRICYSLIRSMNVFIVIKLLFTVFVNMIEGCCQIVVVLSTIRQETAIKSYTLRIIRRNSTSWLPKHEVTVFITLYLRYI